MPRPMTTEQKPAATTSGKEKTPALLFPFLDLKAQHASIREEVLEAVHRVLESQHFILGAEVEALESEVAKLSELRVRGGLCLRVGRSAVVPDGSRSRSGR